MGEDIVEKLQRQFRELERQNDSELVASIGDFSFERRLGESGIAVVYKVKQNSSGEPLAIKILKENIPDDEMDIPVERFKREISALFMLLEKYHNPNLVQPIYHDDIDGRPLYLMEFIPGKDLFYVLEEEGRLDQARALRMVRSIGSVVSNMHENRLIHRDLKPANIMVTGEDYKLIDLGIVRIAYEHDKAPVLKHYEAKPHLTAKGVILGTIGYIPPEQLLGMSVDARGDVYALATIFYTALSGRPPFVQDENEPNSLLIYRIETGDPPPLIQVCPGVSPKLSDAVARAMDREPDKRPTCNEFISDLSGF